MFIYNNQLRLHTCIAGINTHYFFNGETVCVDEKESPTQDFCKRLGTFLGPRLAGVSQEITDYREKTKSTGLVLV